MGGYKDKRFVYIVGVETDQYTAEGERILVCYAVKQTRAAADALAEANPGTSVFKREAERD